MCRSATVVWRWTIVRFAQRLGTIVGHGTAPGAGDRETGRAPACSNLQGATMPAIYSPSDIDLMCNVLDIVYGRLAQRGYGNFSQECIAQRILKCVADGERDLEQLALCAMDGPIEPHSTVH
jgi:hypothetical protein